MAGGIAGHLKRKAEKQDKETATERDRLRKEVYDELMDREGFGDDRGMGYE